MKFGAEYQEALRKEEYPSQWLKSAISYKKLKKCIKRVRGELLSLGLDRETLQALWQHVGTNASSESNDLDAERMMRYQLTTGEGERFVPKLTIALDPRDGSPMDAWLSPETRRILQKVGTRKQRRTSRRTSSFNVNGDNRPGIERTMTNETSESRGSSSERDVVKASREKPRSSASSNFKNSTAAPSPKSSRNSTSRLRYMQSQTQTTHPTTSCNPSL